MSDFSVQTGSLGSASHVIGSDAASMQSEFAWLNAGESFEDRSVDTAVSGLLLTWRITVDRVVGNLYTLAGNLKAAKVAYAAADKEIAKTAAEAAPPAPQHGDERRLA